jgi:hypothetical protein
MALSDFGERIANPAAFYESPAHVLKDITLSCAEKRRVLHAMEVDAAPVGEAADASAPRLDDIEAALRAVDGDDGPDWRSVDGYVA